jgi:glycosyltransferase involved in cell wall biosynthesis
VIASDLGGLSEIVRDGGNGLLFRAGDPDALRAAIERLCGEPGLYDRLRPTPPHGIDADFARFLPLYRGG